MEDKKRLIRHIAILFDLETACESKEKGDVETTRQQLLDAVDSMKLVDTISKFESDESTNPMLKEFHH